MHLDQSHEISDHDVLNKIKKPNFAIASIAMLRALGDKMDMLTETHTPKAFIGAMEHFLEVLIQEVLQYNMPTDTHTLNDDVHGECLSIRTRIRQNAIQPLDSSSKIKSSPVKLKHNHMQHSLMALPKSKSSQRKILRRSSSASSAQQAPVKKRTNYWGAGGMYQGISSSGWSPFQKTCAGFKTAKDESQKQGTGSTPIPT